MSSALAGLKVVEFSQVLGAPHAAQLLAQCGADVVKFEPPAGDSARRMGSMLSGGDRSFFPVVNRRKRLERVDLKEPADRERLITAISEADVFITNQDAAYLASCGLDHATLSASHPGLIYCELSAFGSGGPIGTDGLAQAQSGMTSLNGPPDGDGYRCATSVIDIASGVWLAFGVMVALEERRRTGRGRLLQLSLYEVALALSMAQLTMASVEPGRVRRVGNLSLTACTPTFHASDGRIFTTIIDDRHWSRFCAALGRPDLVRDARFAHEDARHENQALIEQLLDPTFASRTRAEWVERLRAERVPCAPERTIAEVLADASLYDAGQLYREAIGSTEIVQVALPLSLDK